MKKILLVGEIYSANLGDAVICDVVTKLIKKQYPNMEITYCDLSARSWYLNEFKYTLLERVFIFIAKRFFKGSELYSGLLNFLFKKTYFEKIKHELFFTDAVLFVGGQLFMDYFYFPVHQILIYANKFNKPVVFHAIGCKRIKSNLLKNRFNKMLDMQCIKWISIRDGKGIFKFSCLHSNVTYDTALFANDCYYIAEAKEKIIGLGCMRFYELSYSKNIVFWVKIIDHLQQQKIKWKFFCNGAYEDYMLIVAVLHTLKLNLSEYTIRRPICSDDLVKDISSFYKIISFRLHSHIIATSLGIPSVGISWKENKVKDFFTHINHLERYKTIDDSPEDIINTLLDAEISENDKKLLAQQKKNSISDLYDSLQSLELQ